MKFCLFWVHMDGPQLEPANVKILRTSGMIMEDSEKESPLPLTVLSQTANPIEGIAKPLSQFKGVRVY